MHWPGAALWGEVRCALGVPVLTPDDELAVGPGALNQAQHVGEGRGGTGNEEAPRGVAEVDL